MRSVNVFVAARGNAFMADIAGWIVEGAQQLGHPAQLCSNGSLPSDASALNFVVAPHEFYLLSDAGDAEIEAAARCSIPICTEQPGTSWFDMSVLVSRLSAAVLDINPHGVAGLRAAGLDARHLQLGGVSSMDRRSSDQTRSTDVLFMGGLTDHRAEVLATLAPTLWSRRADLRLFSFNQPVDGDVSSLVFGTDKYELLAQAKILVNIHRDGEAQHNEYFEWARMVEAMANGCAIVTEPSTGFEPLTAGHHFIEATDIARTVEELLGQPDRCVEIGTAAAAAVLEEHPLAVSLGAVIDALPSGPDGARRRPPKYRSQLLRAQQIPLLPAFQPAPELRRRVIGALHDEMLLRRSIDAVRCAGRHGDEDHVEYLASPSHADARPEVSVVVTLFNYAHVVIETLDSIVASRDVDLEIVVVDDHSTDESRTVVRQFIDDHPDVPILLVGVDANQGLPSSRNRAIGQARAEKVMMMDADNHVYPTALRRLADALDADPDAAFTWSILEEFGLRTGLRSATSWHVPWLCEANHIDAQAMFRASTFVDHGGYRTDDALVFGWEDWELWLRLAAGGRHGVHVREILGRYRTQENSMLATSNLFGDVMIERLRTLHPTLPWPAGFQH